MAKTALGNLIAESASKNKIFQRNILKDYLQILVLEFIYAHSEYGKLVFYGGSCLAQCHGMPRLSEDLDFVDEKNEINISQMAVDLEEYFRKNTDLPVKTTVQKFRIYLKFPILFDLKLADKSESDLLFVKVEIFKEFNFCKKYKTEIIPLFKYNKALLVKAFDLPTLMATKIRAILHRKWEKTDKRGNVLIAAKGRDYFDLMWYLEKGIKPNIDCIETVDNSKKLKTKLLDIIGKIDAQSIRLDLEAFIDKPDYVRNLSKGIKDILIREIEKKLQ